MAEEQIVQGAPAVVPAAAQVVKTDAVVVPPGDTPEIKPAAVVDAPKPGEPEPKDEPKAVDEELSVEQVKQNNAVMLAAMNHPDVQAIRDVMSDLAADGVDLRMFAEAWQSGDLETIPMDKLAEQLGSAVAARAVKAQLAAEKERIFSARAESEKAVIESVGGMEVWNEARQWAQLPGAISDADKAELNALLAAGGRGAKLAAAEFMKMYKESSVYSQDGSIVPPDIVAAAGGRDLIESRMDYSRLLSEAQGDPQKIAAINARWLMSKRQLNL